MTLPYGKILKWAVLAIALLFVSSWIAGQIRGCFSPRPVKPKPAVIDAGTPVPGPVAEAPTVISCLEIARPDLSREEVLAGMRKYGLKIASGGTRSEQGGVQGERSTVPEATDTPEGGDRGSEGHVARPPFQLAEEHFRHPASGAELDVAAWYMGEGERVDLRGVWSPWTPPPAPAPHYFGNVAKFEKGFLLGYVGLKSGEETRGDPGIGFHLRYRGWKVGKATIDAGVIGLATIHGDGAAMGGIGVSW